MSCGWLKNLELLAESPCATHRVSSRNLSPLKTGSAPRETKGTLEGLGDRRGRREPDTGGTQRSPSQLSDRQLQLSDRQLGQRGRVRPLHLIHGGASSHLSVAPWRGDALSRAPANMAGHGHTTFPAIRCAIPATDQGLARSAVRGIAVVMACSARDRLVTVRDCYVTFRARGPGDRAPRGRRSERTAGVTQPGRGSA
jgi:hypothetical protein